jgi:predicted kinase
MLDDPLKPDAGPPTRKSSAGQRIVLAVGLPGSGKSAWFRNHGITPLSSDHLRLLLADDEEEQGFQVQIFQALYDLLRLRLDLGRPVSYVDATSFRREFRRSFLDIAGERGCIPEALFFDVPLDVCLARNRARGRRVPEDVMLAMSGRLEPPTLEEGFRRIVVVGEQGETLREIGDSAESVK